MLHYNHLQPNFHSFYIFIVNISNFYTLQSFFFFITKKIIKKITCKCNKKTSGPTNLIKHRHFLT